MPQSDLDLNAVLADLAAGLPADVERCYRAGDFAAANARIDALLAQDRLPQTGRGALLAVREIMRRIPGNYTLSRAAALQKLQEQIPDFTEGEFDALLAADRIDWRYIDGIPYYLTSFAEALRLYPDLRARGLKPDDEPDVRDNVIAAMQKNGHLDADITLRATIAPAPGLKVDPEAALCAWLPIPAACEQQSGIEIVAATPGGQIAPEDAPQRCIYWQGKGKDAPFSVTYRYHIHAQAVALDAIRPDNIQPQFYTHEEAPHILFTPWLRALCEEIVKNCDDPLEKARAIYDYVTKNTNYRYQPAYACLEQIADSCAKSGWGDCGVMALLFITLCRIAGVPARWQSGLYVTPDSAGAHDWAQFYIAPYGWLWADCSFGSGAHRMGNENRRQHYFGSLDPLRMVANRSFYAQLTPPDNAWRHDPYDNQVGEMTLAGRGLTGEETVRTQTVVSFVADAPF